MDSSVVANLLKLQEIDTKIQETIDKINAIPSQILQLEKLKEEYSIEVDTLKKKIKELDFQKKNKELDILDLKKKISNIEKALEKVRTNEDYKSLLREKARAEESIIELEDEILSLMEEIESIQTQLKEKEKEREEKTKEIDEKLENIKNQKIQLEQALSSLELERENLVRNLRPQDYNQYENIKKRVKTKPIAIVKDATCTGCYMVIPPKIFSELIKTDKMLSCPNCGRYLYYEKS